MSLNARDDRGFKFVLHGLSAEVLVEGAGSSAERVLSVLKIVFFHVLDQTRSHVLVVGAWAQRGGQLRAGLFMEVSAEQPAGSEDQQEVGKEQCVALLGILHPWGVHVHVVLW